MSTLDLAADMTFLPVRSGRPSGRGGVPEAVAAAYVRDLVDLLPDE